MKHLIILLAGVSLIACASYLFCAYIVFKHMSGRWFRAFLGVLMVDAAVSFGFTFCRIVEWYNTPLLVDVIIRMIAAAAGIGMFLAFSGWLKNGHHPPKNRPPLNHLPNKGRK